MITAIEISHEAATASAYDKWFLSEVEAGIEESDDPNTVMVPQAEVNTQFAAKREALKKRIKAAA